MWDAAQYLIYANERSRPFFDLLARVPNADPTSIADLGCGPGNLTRTLAERWPAAQVVGVDSSPEMLEQAKKGALPGRVDIVQADISLWTPAKPMDLIVSNAAFQWVPDHEVLLPRLAGMLASGGTLAVQMPYHFASPAHRIIEETKADPRWYSLLNGVGLHPKSVLPLIRYVERLYDLGLSIDAWETTYLHVLHGEDPVLEWFMGSALRPLLARLSPADQDPFRRELGGRFKAAYPAKGDVTFFPFPRIFFVATRP